MNSKAWVVCVLALCGVTSDAGCRDALAQAPAAPTSEVPRDSPRFEAVSIKRNTSTSGSLSTRSLPNGGYLMVNSSLRSLISTAYGTSIDTNSLPAWVANERYDVTATSPIQGSATVEQRQAMMRALLAERLNFKARIEQREEEAFDLVLARKDGRLGPNMKPSSADCEARAEAQKAALAAGASPLSLLPPPGDRTGPVPECTGRTGGGVMEGDFSVPSMLFFIRGMAGRQVIDKTGLKGTYTVRLEVAPGRRPGVDSTAAGIDDPPDVFTALPSQLGLKLEPSRVTVNLLIVENMDRPSEN
jgi:uncharacterized protein (TIGR03435 family)